MSACKLRGNLLVAAGCVILLAGCEPRTRERADSSDIDSTARPVVFVVNYPLKYFADRIGGDQIDVVFPVPADQDPAYWQPNDEAIGGFQDADLILMNGATYAKWAAHVSLPPSRMVNTSQAFEGEYIELEDQVVHQHGPEGQHAHEGYAFTTWLDPQLAIQHAEAIRKAFSAKWPDRTDVFDAGWKLLEADLKAVDTELTTANAGYQDEPVLASHPVYQYLARRCAWNLKSLHWEPDEIPGDEQWQELAALLEKHPAKWMVWEAEPLPDVKQRLADLGISCWVFSPCGNEPESGDFLQVMHENIGRLASVLASTASDSTEARPKSADVSAEDP